MTRKNRTEFIRVIKNRNYTVIHNEFLKRDDLSWKAKGILAYVLSLPDDWSINLNELMRHATDGRDSFRSGWKELTDKGYIERYPVKDEKTKRIIRWETKVYENLDLKVNEPHTGKPLVENPEVEKPLMENPKLLSTKDTKYLNKQSTNKEHSPAKAEPEIPYKKIVGLLNQKADRNFRHSTDKTKRLIRARWNEGFALEDFEKVIDIKVSQWRNNPDMEMYLRPETLFGTKFEGYLNEQHTNNNGGESYGGLEF